MFPGSMPAAGEALHDILGTVERSQVQGRDPLAGTGHRNMAKISSTHCSNVPGDAIR